MKNGILIFCLFLFTASSCKKKAVLTQEEVIAVINQFDKGWKNKNTELVDATLAPTYIYFTQSGNTFSRANVVETAGSKEYLLDTMSRTEIMVDLFENTAVVSTRWKGKGIYRGTQFNEDQRCSITIVKASGKVGILSEHCTPIKNGKIFH